MSPFFTIVLSIFLLVVLLQCILISIILPKSIPRTGKTIISALIAFCINTIPFLYMGREPILDQLAWWHRELIVFPYAILLVSSALSGLFLMLAWPVTSLLQRLWPQYERGKRDFLKNSARAFLGTSVGVLAYGSYCENRAPEISRVALQYNRLHPDLSGFRIVQLTDLHAGPLISFETIAKIVSTANALKPDLIVLTGDYVNHNPTYIRGCLGLLDELRAPAGVFGVYGNHDHYTGIGAMREAFSKTHICMLSDSHGGAKGLERLVNVIGIEDPVRGWATDAQFQDVGEIFGLAVPDRFNLLLSHRPGIFGACKDCRINLTLAGHTHGGQIIVPGVGERGFSFADFFFTYTHGLYQSEKDPQVRMYVSRGIGTIVAPVRLFCKPEIVEITLTKA